MKTYLCLRRAARHLTEIILVLTAAGGLAIVFFTAAVQVRPASAAQEHPNILFFLADDQRNDTLGFAGHPIIETPNTDHLAARGVMFENAFVQASICWVSRTTILTGLTARSFGSSSKPETATREALSQFHPDLLRDAGYRTGFYGKWHVKAPADFKPEAHFDEFENIYRKPYFKVQPDGTKRHTTDLIADRSIKFLETQPRDTPFVLYLWFNAAHAEDGDKRPAIGHYPWPPSVDGLYDDIEVPAPRLSDPALFEALPDFLKTSINRERFFWRWDTPEKYQTNIRAYFRMITGIDRAIGRVVETLAQQGLAENTIVVYSADNGYYMGDRGFAGKWYHFDQSLRIPLIIYDPRLPETLRGRVVGSFTLNLDLPPTFLSWAGVGVPSEYQGRSLVPVVESSSPPDDWRTEFFAEHVSLAPKLTWEGVRTTRYAYARYFDQVPPYEFLYELESDADQLRNLAGNPQYEQTLSTLRTRTDQYVALYGGSLAPLSARSVYPQPKNPDRDARPEN